MKLGIMQPYFFPYIGYWQLINAVDKYIIYDDVNFIKGGWINRNKILMNGREAFINLQMNKASPNKLINEVGVQCDPIYNKKLLRTLEACYKKAPYYSSAFPVIESVITQDEKNLSKYLEFSIKKICEYLSINTQIGVSSSINKDNNLRGQDKVMEICSILNADEYINAIGGQALYSYEDFSNNKIKLGFLKTCRIEYKQFDNPFIPNLSIIDVMMFNSKIEIIGMLNMFRYV